MCEEMRIKTYHNVPPKNQLAVQNFSYGWTFRQSYNNVPLRSAAATEK